MGPTSILRRALLPSLLAALLAPPTLLLVPTVLLAPLFGWVVAACLRAHLREGTETPVAPIGTLAIALAALTGGGVLGMLVGSAAGRSLAPSSPAWGAAAGAAFAPLLGLLALAPLVFAPLAWLERDRRRRRSSLATLAAVIGSALEAWRISEPAARWRPIATVATPWMVGAALVGGEASPRWWLWTLGPVVAITVPLACACLVAGWVSVRRVALRERPGVTVPGGLAILGASAALTSAVALGAVAWSLFTPLSMTEVHLVRAASRALQPRWAGWHRRQFAIPGTTLAVRPDSAGVHVEAADGGGVGLVRLRGGVAEVRVEPIGGGYRVHAQGPQGRGFFDIDPAGVRRDDAFHDRVRFRLGRLGLLLLCVVVGAWGAIVVAGGRLHRAFGLRDLPQSDAPWGAADERCVLEGRLRLADGAHVRQQGARFVVDGSAWIDGPGLRVALPPDGARVQGACEHLVDGAEVTLVGRFPQRTAAAFREATAPWPFDAWLVPGGREEAVRGEVRRASVTLALALTVTLLAALGLVGWILATS